MLNDNCKYELIGYRRIEYTISMIDGKWKMRILYMLGFHKVLRYGELKKHLDPISHKMLSNQLKELEHDGLIERNEYPQIPPKVEYSMSIKGYDLLPMFDKLCDWIQKYKIGRAEGKTDTGTVWAFGVSETGRKKKGFL